MTFGNSQSQLTAVVSQSHQLDFFSPDNTWHHLDATAGAIYVGLYPTLVQGAPLKNNPLGKINYISYCNSYFHQIYSFYRGGFRPHIVGKFRYNIYCGLKITTIRT